MSGSFPPHLPTTAASLPDPQGGNSRDLSGIQSQPSTRWARPAVAISSSPMTSRSAPAPSTRRPFCAPWAWKPLNVAYENPPGGQPTAVTGRTPAGSSITTSTRSSSAPPMNIQDFLPEFAQELRDQPPGARHPLRRGRLGIAHGGRLGTGLGSLARRDGDHPVHLLPAGRRHRHLNPVCSEITYGIERIAMYLQGIDNVYDLEWAHGVKYGDVHHQGEAGVVARQLRGSQRRDAPGDLRHTTRPRIWHGRAGLRAPHLRLLPEMLPHLQPADARGAISVAERTTYIGRPRAQPGKRLSAKGSPQAAREMGFPLMGKFRK